MSDNEKEHVLKEYNYVIKMYNVVNFFLFFFTHTPMCLGTVYSWKEKNISQAYYSGGIWTHDPCNSRASVVYV